MVRAQGSREEKAREEKMLAKNTQAQRNQEKNTQEQGRTIPLPKKLQRLSAPAFAAALSQPRVSGDPLGETRALLRIQRALGTKPGVLPVARGLSHFGEHALGWMAVAALGWLSESVKHSPTRGSLAAQKRQWIIMGVSACGAHAASIILKRVIRRVRPHAHGVQIAVGTPSKLSCPSSHATSSTAALVCLADIAGNPTPLLGVPVMALSRMVVGVHYPSDVALGSLLGAVVARVTSAALTSDETNGGSGFM